MPRRIRRALPDLALILTLLCAPLAMFHQQTVGERTLLPAENLYQHLPYSAYRDVAGAPPFPHNALLSDMVLQNLGWKRFIREQIAQGEIPLWNPHILAGLPFFAAGQHSALYPLSVVYYLLPLSAAFGWFIVLNLWLAGLFMAGYMRALGVDPAGAGLAGLAFQLSGFMIANAVFPMMVAAAAWLPLILWMIENILRGRKLWFFRATPLIWVVIGALAIACNVLAGHIELTLYTLMIAAFYALCRLIQAFLRRWREGGRPPALWAARTMLWLAALFLLGIGTAALQLIPLYEFAGRNWRAERSSLETVLGYAHPPRDLLQFVLPNFFGSPAQHSYTDAFSGELVTDLRGAGLDRDYIDWGLKNYVEGALYVGALPLVLALYALVSGWRRAGWGGHLLILGFIALVALSFMFGAPSYALIFQLPGMNQLHSPFRWVFALSFALAALAGIGLHLLQRRAGGGLKVLFCVLLLAAGLAIAAGAAAAQANFEAVEPLFDRAVAELAGADQAYSGGRMFFSHLLPQLRALAVVLLLGSAIFLWSAWKRSRFWLCLALIVTAGDLLLATHGFNPASDPLLLDFTPPSIQFLRGQPGHFRVTSLQRPGDPSILPPNMGMRYGIDDIRGYDSIIPASTVAAMRALQPQYLLDHNQIAPLYTDPALNYAGYDLALNSDLLNLLNVRYVLTAPDYEIIFPGWRDVYRQEVAIWENETVMPRAFLVDKADWDPRWLAEQGGGFHYGELDVLGGGLHIPRYEPATITRDTGREKFIDIRAESDSWLVVSESWMPGWRAFIRPRGAGEGAEFGAAARLVLAKLQGLELPPGDWTVRLVYSPASVQLGMFVSSISAALIVFLLGAWFWRAYIGLNRADSSGLARVARNSAAPILLNLFNRGIDFAFAIVMYRLLLPLEVGIYNFAVVLFVAFDIFTNFGLDLFLIREASQKPKRAGHYLYNSSFFRLVLSLAGAPLLAGVMLLWQGAGVEAIGGEGLLAIGLLYIGLFPASLSKGMTSLFYANEQAEKPAAIATITTMNKAVFGVIALLLGHGIVGLAAISIFNNLLTLAVLLWAGRRLIGQLGRRLPDLALIREMARESYPLMLNHFLATVFFQVDIVILQALKGAETVAQYGTAYKWLLALNIVPAFFTQALFPVMSRQAEADKAAFSRTFRFSLKLLFAVALPLAVVFTALAEPLTLLLGGARYIPQGAVALQLMIWSIPIGWMNSLTQYALVSLGLQRMITRAFAAAVAFNVVANLLFIPTYGFQAAAIATIASELALFLPFILLLRGQLAGISLAALLWRPVLALAAMLLCLLLLGSSLPGLVASAAAYALTLLLLRPLDAAESLALLNLLPASLRGQSAVRWMTGAPQTAQ